MKSLSFTFFFFAATYIACAQNMSARQVTIDSLLDAGKYTEALTLANEDYESVFANPESDLFQKANSVRSLGQCTRLLKQVEKTRALFKGFMEDSKALGLDSHPAMPIVLSEWSVLETTQLNYEEAEKILIRAQHLIDSTGQVPIKTQVSVLMRTGYMFSQRRDFQRAVEVYLKALAFMEKQHLEKKQTYHTVCDNLTSAYVYLDNAEGVEKYSKIGLELAREKGFPQERILNTVAFYQYRSGDYKKAEQSFLSLKSYLEVSGKKNETYARCLLYLGYVYYAVHFFNQGDELITQAYQLVMQSNQIGGSSINFHNMFVEAYAKTLFTKGEYEEALKILREAWVKNTEIKGNEYNAFVFEYDILLVLTLRDGIAKTGSQFITFREKVNAMKLRNYHFNLFASTLQIAAYWNEIDSFNNFEIEMKRAYSLVDSIEMNRFSNLVSAKTFDYECRFASGHYKEALEPYFDCIRLNWDFQSNYMVDFLASERINYYNDLKPKFEYYLQCLSVIPDLPLHEELLDYQMNMKSLLLDFDKTTKKKLAENPDQSIQKEYLQWQQLRKKYYNIIQDYSSEQIANDSIALKLKLEIETLEKELLQHSDAFKNLRTPKSTSSSQIRSALEPDAAAIEIFRIFKTNLLTRKDIDSAIYAVILLRKNQTLPDIIFFRNGDEMETILAEQYRQQAAADHPNPLITSKIYESFWAPLTPYLKGIRTIYFSPDGVFHKINPEILQNPDGKYLADIYKIKRVNVLSDLNQKPPETPASALIGKTAVLFGNPDFSEDNTAASKSFPSSDSTRSLILDVETERGIILKPLPGSEKEVQSIEALFRTKNWNTQVFTGKEASEEHLKMVKSPTILHLATHGYFLENPRISRQTLGLDKEVVLGNPLLRSMLFFKGAQHTLNKLPRDEAEENGILSAEEAQDLSLEGCELVVLSACGSGLGKIETGEGVFGLQRAFQVAGAKAIIVSLWEVEDKVTQLLMTAFYKNWLGGMSKQEAFNTAQKTVREKYPQPFYWGAFVMIGG